jgi:protein-L-isoaspartate(D-aspartate) O-methyltransferase
MDSQPDFALQRRRMVREQIISRGLTDPRLLAALEKVERHCFVPDEELAWAYSDCPLPIGQGQTISQPYIVALMTHLLDPKPSAKVLEVGTGSGYQAAILGELAACVHTMETIPSLARKAGEILSRSGYGNIHVHLGDGSCGFPEHAPYDGILVGAASPGVPPPLLEQLTDGGRLVLPVGGHGFQILEVHQRIGKRIQKKESIPVAFVPLRGKFGWK